MGYHVERGNQRRVLVPVLLHEIQNKTNQYFTKDLNTNFINKELHKMEDVIEKETTRQFSLTLIGGGDIDDEKLQNQTHSLLRELNDVSGIDQVNTVSKDLSEVTKGTKGVSGVLGKLLIDISVKAVPSVANYIRDWVMRPGARAVEIEVEGKNGKTKIIFDPSSISSEKIESLVTALRSQVSD